MLPMLNFNVFSHKNVFLLCPTYHKCQLNLGHLQEKHRLYGNCRHICNFYCQGHIFLNQVTIFRESTHQLRNICSDRDMCKQDFFFSIRATNPTHSYSPTEIWLLEWSCCKADKVTFSATALDFSSTEEVPMGRL